MTLIIGLTGGIGSGKSTISLMIDHFNVPVIDADKLSREVVEPGEQAYKEIIASFGKDILLNDETIDRKKLGDIVFNNKKKRKELNHIVHPAVREKMLKQKDDYVNKGVKGVVLDIPLLFESELTSIVNKIIVVYVDEYIQVNRLMDRNNFSEQEALQRIYSQMSVKEKAKRADAVINNNGTKADAYEQLKELLYDWDVL